ncbi:MAG: cytochrome-c oxidase, cbb3-type subunit III [Blastomonas sp.]
MSDNKRIDDPTGTETVGHEWDGIEELNTPLPRWWLWTFYVTIVWAIGYTVVYPAWPMLESATAGTFGWTSRGQLEQEIAEETQRRAGQMRALAEADIAGLPANEALFNFAVEGGRSAFKVHCVQCHGSGASGSKGYPNLNDDEWLWGGDLATLDYTITHGVRQPDHAETRFSQMPAFGRDGILTPIQVQDVVSHVRTLSGAEQASASSRRGADVYAANCAVCHGDAGQGDRTQGAPNLTDAIWLYGGDRATLVDTVNNARYGVMPRWGERLDPVTIKMLAAYVHSLGGGEAAPAAVEPVDAAASQVALAAGADAAP